MWRLRCVPNHGWSACSAYVRYTCMYDTVASYFCESPYILLCTRRGLYNMILTTQYASRTKNGLFLLNSARNARRDGRFQFACIYQLLLYDEKAVSSSRIYRTTAIYLSPIMPRVKSFGGIYTTCTCVLFCLFIPPVWR